MVNCKEIQPVHSEGHQPWDFFGRNDNSATSWTMQPMEFSRPEYWRGYLFPSSGDLPNPGIEPSSPTLQADCLPAEPQGKPKIKNMVIIKF